MKVVSDSSTLIALARIDSVHLLPKLYGQILIPTEVYKEVVIEGAATLRHTGLGAGEVSAIIRAKELSAGLTLIDEPRARWYAKMRRSQYYWYTGILETLCRRGHAADLRNAAFGQPRKIF